MKLFCTVKIHFFFHNSFHLSLGRRSKRREYIFELTITFRDSLPLSPGEESSPNIFCIETLAFFLPGMTFEAVGREKSRKKGVFRSVERNSLQMTERVILPIRILQRDICWFTLASDYYLQHCFGWLIITLNGKLFRMKWIMWRPLVITSPTPICFLYNDFVLWEFVIFLKNEVQETSSKL